ncbi:MAG TPA: competence/damage-inducible protein A [Tissierellaceae bacterium]|nr:competence/damage-inducible protein A [Tissierellaceae bacterium]
MITAEIITVGSEITLGSTLNTNSKFIASELFAMGIETLYHSSVDDDEKRLKEILNTSIKRVDLIVITGGLGPTADDLTKEVVAEALDLKLVPDKDMENKIKSIFHNSSRVMSKNNLKQSLKIENSDFLQNTVGTAPGIFLHFFEKQIILLPGPPREMKPMFINEVLPLLTKGNYIINKSINLTDIGESYVEMNLKDLLNYDPNIKIATYAKETEVEIRIIGQSNDNIEQLKDKVQNLITIIEDRFKKYIYGFDNKPIEKIVFDLLIKANYKVGFCESCTGGLLSGRFSRIPGVSQVFDRAIITYSNNAKIEELKVNRNTLKEFSAVSKETALEMALGLLNKTDLDLVVSTTGYAGPETSEGEKSVGLVYICIADRNKNKIIESNFNGNRENIQNKTVTKCFYELKKFLT